MEFSFGGARVKTGSFIFGVIILGAILLYVGWYLEHLNGKAIDFALISTGGFALFVFGIIDVIITIVKG